MRKKLLLMLAATAAFATPALAWLHHPTLVEVDNRSDPVKAIKIAFKVPGVLAPVIFPLDLPSGGTEIVGPIPEAGQCDRMVVVTMQNVYGEVAAFRSATPMNVCIETIVTITGEWPGFGAPPGGITISHH